MSIEVPVAFQQKYRNDFILLSQQQGSRLRRTVRTDPDRLDGKAGFFDRIGAVAMTEITGRHQPTALSSTPHSRRRITMRDFAFADAVDWQDAIRLGKDPKPKYSQNAMMAAGRTMDDLIIGALGGNAVSIDADDASTTVALPSAQKIATGSGGLTLLKLRQAKKLLDAAEAGTGQDGKQGGKRFMVVTTNQMDDLLGTTQVTSSDFNSVKALVDGTINSFLGFEFIRTERLIKSSTTRYCYAYTDQAIGLAVGQEPMIDMGVRRDLNMAVQIYVAMMMDCTRIEDVQVVQIACTES